MTGIRAILIIDAEGRVLSSNNKELLGRDLSGRDYFQNARKNPNPQTLYVSPPFKTVTNNFVVSLYRIITGPNGEFARIVLASTDPEFAATLLDSVRYRSDVWSYLAHGDGKLITMAPERKGLSGTDLAAPDSTFTRHRNSAQPGSVFSGPVDAGGEKRLIALRTIQPASLFMDKPLVVAVSRDAQNIFADWLRRAPPLQVPSTPDHAAHEFNCEMRA